MPVLPPANLRPAESMMIIINAISTTDDSPADNPSLAERVMLLSLVHPHGFIPTVPLTDLAQLAEQHGPELVWRDFSRTSTRSYARRFLARHRLSATESGPAMIGRIPEEVLCLAAAQVLLPSAIRCRER